MKKIFQARFFFFFFLLGIFLYITFPFFHKGFFPTLDDVQIVRTDVMFQELSSGQFPVRYVNSFGNGGGYFFFTFYSPFVYYLGALYHLLGLTLVKAEKLVFLTGFVVAIVSMYILLREFVERKLAFVGALLFITSPFLSYEVYTRGTVAEFYGMAFFPMVFWAFLRLRKHETYLAVVLAGTLLGLLMLVHSFLGICMAMVIGLLLVLPPYRKGKMITIIAASILGAGVSAFFWLPVFLEQPLTRYSMTYFGSASYLTNFLTPLQAIGLVKIPWSFRPPLVGSVLGIGSLVAIVCTIIKKKISLYLFFVLGFLGSLFLASPWSEFLWSHISFLQYLQFPWRFFAPATVFGVLIVITGLSHIKNRFLSFSIGISLVILGVVLYSLYFRPTGYNFISRYFAEDQCTTSTWAGEYLPKYAYECLPKPKNHQATTFPLLKTTDEISNVKETDNGRNISFIINGEKSTVVVRRYYFPSWEVLVDKKPVSSFPSGQYGLIGVHIPQGRHKVEIHLENTFIESLGNAISLFSIGVILLLCIQYKIHKKS